VKVLTSHTEWFVIDDAPFDILESGDITVTAVDASDIEHSGTKPAAMKLPRKIKVLDSASPRDNTELVCASGHKPENL
jgi:hypothetical protein